MPTVNIYQKEKQTVTAGSKVIMPSKAASSTYGFKCYDDGVEVRTPGIFTVTFQAKIAAIAAEALLGIQLNGRTLSGVSTITTSDTSFLPFTITTTACVRGGCCRLGDVIDVVNIGADAVGVEDASLIVSAG